MDLSMPRGWATAALACLVTSAFAQQAPVADRPERTQETVQVSDRAIAAYRLAPQEFYNYEQRYLLENGMVLSFHEKRRHYYVQYRDETPLEIFPLAEGVFMTAAGSRMEFKEEGDIIAISHLELLPYAGGPAIDPARVYVARR